MQELIQYQTEFEAYLSNNKIEKGPTELYEPVNYILSLGGKRLRPVVLLMAYNLYQNDFQKVLPAAMAIEVFHNFTLVHDDIMDHAPLRRGKPTVHEKYDLNTGILSGDVMLVQAYEYLLPLSGLPNFQKMLEVFTRTCIEVCEGQQMDMNFESRSDVTIDEYLKMIELKTSVLVACSMKMGAFLAGAPVDEAEMVYQFGRNLGIAFQIQDDILDTFGDPEKFGKKVGGDIAQNKKTYLMLKALEVAPEAEKAELMKWYGQSECDEKEKIEKVKAIFLRLNVPKLSETAKEEFQAKALSQLEKLRGKGRDCRSLELFANQLMGREK